MGEPVSLEISTNVQDYPFEKRYYTNLTIKEFKVKLELIVGAEASSIALKLLDSEGKVLADMSDDNKTLKDYKVKSGMRVYACDMSGENQTLNDDSMVEKYEMPDSAYEQREDSVRAWKKKLMAEKASTQVQKDDPNVEAIKGLKVGERCQVTVKGQMEKRGVVAFLGETKFKSGLWVGVKYDEPVGKNDGTVEGVRYFHCDPHYGGFARPVDVKVGDYPEMDIDEM